MATPDEKDLVKKGAQAAYQEQVRNLFLKLVGDLHNAAGSAQKEAEAINSAKAGLTVGLRALHECTRLADNLP